LLKLAPQAVLLAPISTLKSTDEAMRLIPGRIWRGVGEGVVY